MKKLVAISVLFAGLATAVFAQSGGWSNAWTFGLTAKYNTDVFYAAAQSGKSEAIRTTTPDAIDLDGTVSKEWGKYSKGVAHFFPETSRQNELFDVADNQLFVRLENSGENYAIRFNFGLNAQSWNGDKLWARDFTFMDLLSGGNGSDDWGVKANVGIFSLGIGPWATEAAFVDTNATWGSSWLGWGSYNRYGVWTLKRGWIHSNHFRTLNQWGNPFSVGMKLGDSFKFTLGYSFNWDDRVIGNPKTDNRSSMNGAFMFSGSPVDAFAFDLFYAITGMDNNTLSRTDSLPANVQFGYKDPSGSWNNLIGAYVQIKAIENLFLSLGYTVNFNAFEAGAFICSDADFTQSKKVTYNSPIYSGIDLRLGFNGIDKVGIKFNNNISFAGVKGDKLAKDPEGEATYGAAHGYVYKDTINLLFNEDFKDARVYGDGLSQDYFHWDSRLEVALSFIDGVPLQLSIGNRLQVLTNKIDKTEVISPVSAPVATTEKTVGTNTTTTNELKVGVGAKYGMGGVTLGLGLVLKVSSTLVDDERSFTFTSSAGGTPTVNKRTFKSNDDKVEFGVPLTFSLSF